MSEIGDLLRESAERLLTDLCTDETRRAAHEGTFPDGLWAACEEAGFPRALAPEAAGGAGLGPSEAMPLLAAAGRHAAPVPLADSILAHALAGHCGLDAPDGPLTLAPPPMPGETAPALRDGTLSGRAARVPWGARAEAVLLLAETDGRTMLVLAAPKGAEAAPGTNLAGEPRDTLTFAGTPALAAAPAPDGLDGEVLRALGGAVRAAQMAGALGFVLEATVAYARERTQFGRPIGRFQAIQHNLARLAGEAAAARAAAEAGLEAAGRMPGLAGGGAGTGANAPSGAFALVAAKIRAGEAAGIAAAIAHQVHGAMGFTHEHRLHFATRRLWSWRDEFGNEAFWSARLGALLAEADPDRLWETISAA